MNLRRNTEEGGQEGLIESSGLGSEETVRPGCMGNFVV